MVIPDLKQLCFATMALLVSVSVQAQIYKWVDENGQTHYSQQPPTSGEAQLMDVPRPPPINAEEAQQEVDELIEQQQEAEKAELEAQQAAEEEAKQQAIKDKNCQIARQNLTNYQNNPGRRVVDEEGNVTRLAEEDRQQKMVEFQEQIDLYCQ